MMTMTPIHPSSYIQPLYLLLHFPQGYDLSLLWKIVFVFQDMRVFLLFSCVFHIPNSFPWFFNLPTLYLANPPHTPIYPLRSFHPITKPRSLFVPQPSNRCVYRMKNNRTTKHIHAVHSWRLLSSEEWERAREVMSGLGIAVGSKQILDYKPTKTTRLPYVQSIHTYHIAQIPQTSPLDRKLATVAWGIEKFTSPFF